MKVFVRDNNVHQALKVLKEKVGKRRLVSRVEAPPGIPENLGVRERADSICRVRKLERQKAQREGLLPKPKAKSRPDRRSNNFQSGRPEATNSSSVSVVPSPTKTSDEPNNNDNKSTK